MEKKWLELYEKLVNTDTGYDVSVEEKLNSTKFIAKVLEGFGFEIRTGKASHMGFMGESPYVTLIAHLDTVFKKGEVEERKFRVEGDVVYGPGVADTKGGVIVLLAALDVFLKKARDVSIAVVLNVDEEVGSPKGKEDHYNVAKNSRFCLSFETGRKNGAIVVQRKGIASLEVEVVGKAGHASKPSSGVNAAVEIADKILKINELNGKVEGLTVVPTIVTSGYKSNVIPENAYAFFDVRYMEKEDINEFRLLLEDVFHTTAVDGAVSSYKIELKRPPMKRYEEAVKVAERAMKGLGINYELITVGGGSDAAFYTDVGVSALDGLGIIGRYIHSDREEAYLDSFTSRVELAVALLETLFETY